MAQWSRSCERHRRITSLQKLCGARSSVTHCIVHTFHGGMGWKGARSLHHPHLHPHPHPHPLALSSACILHPNLHFSLSPLIHTWHHPSTDTCPNLTHKQPEEGEEDDLPPIDETAQLICNAKTLNPGPRTQKHESSQWKTQRKTTASPCMSLSRP